MPGHKGNKNGIRFTDNDKKAMFSFAQIIADLNAAWQPHEGQVSVGKALFKEGKKRIAIQCGRKWGKSEFGVYALWLYALTHPGAECYYIAPQLKQAKEIVWDNFRLQSCNTSGNPHLVDHAENLSKYVKNIREAQCRINFHNGSFIKVDGSDNYNAHRGTRPHFIVYDEAGFMDSRFHTVMAPNLLVHKAPLLSLTTPPETENWYTNFAEDCNIRDDGFYKEAPSWENNRIPGLKEEIERERKLLFARGEGDVFQREFCGKFVLGGSNAIFPMVNPGMMENHEEIMKEIGRDRKKLQWFTIVDPGYITCFAVLFAAYNPYTKKVYWLDCIYEQEISKMSDDQIWPRIVEKMNKLYPNCTLPTHTQLEENGNADWVVISDENPASFRKNIPSMFGVSIRASGKKPLKKEEGLSLIKDQILNDRVSISTNCGPLVTEMIKYIRDENGNIPKKGDHLIDTVRYLNLAIRYTFQMTKHVPKEVDPLDKLRNRRSLENDLYQMRLEETGLDLPGDWDGDIYDSDWNTYY